VDDAARAFVLLSNLWVATGNHQLRVWAEGLLDFVLWMHAGDGRWVNFIYDWAGTRNLNGPTSTPGPNFWQARATLALTVAVLRLDRAEARPLLSQAIAAAAGSSPPADVRAIHAVAALELLRAEADPWLLSQLGCWCNELAACSLSGVLMNSPDERGRPHLWAHIQEAVLVDAAVVLDRSDLRGIAQRSADAVFEEVIESGFDLPHIQPYDVESAAFVMDRMAAATDSDRYRDLGRKARAWFSGRNPAGAPVYESDRGRVADGIDDGNLNGHSGAEANISAGLALSDVPAVRRRAASWLGPLPSSR
jgi:hypothetical protein